MAVAPKVRRYIATDQDYVFKILQHNLLANAVTFSTKSLTGRHPLKPSGQLPQDAGSIELLALDWESSSLDNLSQILGIAETEDALDLIVASDCIYNEALIDPFVRTCSELCHISSQKSAKRTACVIAQQLRSYDVFEAWLTAFHKVFQVWRVPDEYLTSGLRTGSGFTVHVGVVRDRTVL